MKSDILALICDPATRDALDIMTEPDARGRLREFLVNPRTDWRFPIRDGVPIFLLENEVSGSNRRYQAMYDRLARLYDFSTWLYSRWKGMSVEARLREYLDELEVAAGSRDDSADDHASAKPIGIRRIGRRRPPTPCPMNRQNRKGFAHRGCVTHSTILSASFFIILTPY